jgi:hypothetical protein
MYCVSDFCVKFVNIELISLMENKLFFYILVTVKLTYQNCKDFVSCYHGNCIIEYVLIIYVFTVKYQLVTKCSMASVAGCHEHGYEPSGSIKGGEFLDQQSDC